MRRSTLIPLLAILVLVTLIVYSSLSSGQVECEVCLTYNGRTKCATAAGPTEDDARAAATTTACATLAAGRAQSLECDRTPPTRLTCR